MMQHKALYNRGAAPKILKIDTLLGAINGKINEQKKS
jgi:hypothetical protein